MSKINAGNSWYDEKAHWTSPASILYRWKTDSQPCGTSDAPSQMGNVAIKIRRVDDVDAYMEKRFGKSWDR